MVLERSRGMGFWSSFFGKSRRRGVTTGTSSASSAEHPSASADCPFCGALQIEWDKLLRIRTRSGSATVGWSHPVRSHRTLTKFATRYFMMLGIDARASESEEQTGHPSITMQPYDTGKAAGNVADVLTMHGYVSWITRTRIPATTLVDLMSRHGVEWRRLTPDATESRLECPLHTREPFPFATHHQVADLR